MYLTDATRLTETTMPRRHVPSWIKLVALIGVVFLVGSLGAAALAAALIAG